MVSRYSSKKVRRSNNEGHQGSAKPEIPAAIEIGRIIQPVDYSRHIRVARREPYEDEAARPVSPLQPADTEETRVYAPPEDFQQPPGPEQPAELVEPVEQFELASERARRREYKKEQRRRINKNHGSDPRKPRRQSIASSVVTDRNDHGSHGDLDDNKTITRRVSFAAEPSENRYTPEIDNEDLEWVDVDVPSTHQSSRSTRGREDTQSSRPSRHRDSPRGGHRHKRPKKSILKQYSDVRSASKSPSDRPQYRPPLSRPLEDPDEQDGYETVDEPSPCTPNREESPSTNPCHSRSRSRGRKQRQRSSSTSLHNRARTRTRSSSALARRGRSHSRPRRTSIYSRDQSRGRQPSISSYISVYSTHSIDDNASQYGYRDRSRSRSRSRPRSTHTNHHYSDSNDVDYTGYYHSSRPQHHDDGNEDSYSDASNNSFYEQRYSHRPTALLQSRLSVHLVISNEEESSSWSRGARNLRRGWDRIRRWAAAQREREHDPEHEPESDSEWEPYNEDKWNSQWETYSESQWDNASKRSSDDSGTYVEEDDSEGRAREIQMQMEADTELGEGLRYFGGELSSELQRDLVRERERALAVAMAEVYGR